MLRPLASLLVATVLALTLHPGALPRAEAQVKQPSKMPDAVLQVLGQLEAAGRQRVAARAAVDLTILSTGLVRVNAAGKVELVFHAAGTVGDAEVRDLEALGADVVITLRSPAGMIQAWVPYQEAQAAVLEKGGRAAEDTYREGGGLRGGGRHEKDSSRIDACLTVMRL